MARINLLSKELIAKRKAKKWVFLGVVGVIGIVFFLFLVYTTQVTRLRLLKAEIARLDEKIAKYHELQERLTRIREEKATTTKRLDAIKTLLEKDRFLWCHLFEEMSRCLPEGVWLTSMNDKEGDTLAISAVALDNFAIANFMTNLKKSPYFDEVELIRLTTGKIGEYDTKNFDLICKVNI